MWPAKNFMRSMWLAKLCRFPTPDVNFQVTTKMPLVCIILNGIEEDFSVFIRFLYMHEMCYGYRLLYIAIMKNCLKTSLGRI